MTKARDLANIISTGVPNSLITLDAAEIPNISTDKLTTGTLADARIADLSATKLTGTINNARISLDAAEIPNLDTAKVTTGAFADARIPDLNASKITAGTIATARLGSGTADGTTFLRGDGAYAAAGGGKIGQVVSTAVTTTVDADTATSFEDVAGLTVAITPAATSSKILIDVTMNIGADAANHCMARMMRDSTPICIGTGSIGSKTPCTWHMKPYSSSAAQAFSMSFLDSPSSTSEINYHMEWIEKESNSLFLNKTEANTDNANYPATASTITVSEVLA